MAWPILVRLARSIDNMVGQRNIEIFTHVAKLQYFSWINTGYRYS